MRPPNTLNTLSHKRKRLDVRDDLRDSLGGARGGRDDVACAPGVRSLGFTGFFSGFISKTETPNPER